MLLYNGLYWVLNTWIIATDSWNTIQLSKNKRAKCWPICFIFKELKEIYSHLLGIINIKINPKQPSSVGVIIR